MNTLYFEEDYEKLPEHWENTHAICLVAGRTTMKELTKTAPLLLKRDIKYRGRKGSFFIDYEKVIIAILFHKKTGIIFTTIRKDNELNSLKFWSPDKLFVLRRSKP